MTRSIEYQLAAKHICETVQPEGDPIFFNDVRRIYRFSQSLLYKMTSKGEIPCHKFKRKGKLYFYRNQIDAMMRWKFGRSAL